MKFTETPLSGAFIIDPDLLEDERGFFARVYCEEEFHQHGLIPQVVQSSISFNPTSGTLRGMHYQAQPDAEIKLVRCTRGAIYDVIVDLRRDSPTYKDWFAVELNEDNARQLYIPEDFAHGFVSLKDDTEVLYQISTHYHPPSARGFRYNDPGFDIDWPFPIKVISDKDNIWPDFQD
ncbi:MAG: dTDP-4-dehydrorhamnose 3,5-epimerase [Anaerolineales bacterium]|jgi:dTDP-4-dehydrorhamnose 3,5-epimerase